MATISSSEPYVLSERLQVKDYLFDVPLDPINSKFPGTIKVFARAVRSYNHKDPTSTSWTARPEPFVVFLQGGPGFECSPPSRSGGGITGFLVDRGYQVLLLDQRGTGLSNALSAEKIGSMSVEELALYRADYIVRDCEAIRECLIGSAKWSVLGQSFGGFVSTTYLSYFPDSLKEVFTTGGMPPLIKSSDELVSIYSNLYEKVAARNKTYYMKYPKDAARMTTILKYLQSSTVTMPNGGILTPRRFLSLGLSFGSHGGVDSIHFLIHRCATEIETDGKLSPNSLNRIQQFSGWEYNPIYSVLHEACYLDGFGLGIWAAQQALVIRKQQGLTAEWEDGQEQPLMTGEMVFDWFFDDFAELRQCKDVMKKLVEYNGWSKLYDVEQLKKNTVPVYSAIYMEDMYVNFQHAYDTAKTIQGNKVYVTNVMFHDALRSRTDEVLGALFKLSEEIAD